MMIFKSDSQSDVAVVEIQIHDPQKYCLENTTKKLKV